MVVRIAGLQEQAPLLPKTLDIVLISHVVSGRQLMMDQGGGGLVYDAPAIAPATQAKVDVVVDDAMALVKSPDRVEPGTLHHYAGAGHCNDIARSQGEAEVAGVRPRGKRNAWRPDCPGQNIPACCTLPSGYSRRAPTAPISGLSACWINASIQSGSTTSMSSFRKRRSSPRDRAAPRLQIREKLKGPFESTILTRGSPLIVSK